MTPNTLPWAAGFTKSNAVEVYCKATHKRIAQCSAKGEAGVEEIANAAFIERACNAHETLLARALACTLDGRARLAAPDEALEEARGAVRAAWRAHLAQCDEAVQGDAR